jgi:hypothetical protein
MTCASTLSGGFAPASRTCYTTEPSPGVLLEGKNLNPAGPAKH